MSPAHCSVHQSGVTATGYVRLFVVILSYSVKFLCTFLDNVQRSSSSGSRDNSVGVVAK